MVAVHGRLLLMNEDGLLDFARQKVLLLAKDLLLAQSMARPVLFKIGDLKSDACTDRCSLGLVSSLLAVSTMYSASQS